MELNFKYSEKIVKQRKKIINVMAIILPVAMLIFAYILKGVFKFEDPTLFFTICMGIAVLMVLEILIVSKVMFKKLRSMALTLTDAQIERKGGKYSEVIRYDELVEMKITKDPSEKVVSIKLSSKKKSFAIVGFENMEDIINQVTSKLEDPSIVIEKKWKYDWNSPKISLITGGVTILVIGLLMYSSLDVYMIFNYVFIGAMGSYILVFKPISKNGGKRFRIFEIICSSLMLIGLAFMIVGRLFQG